MKDYKDLNDYELMYMVSENDECAKELIYEKYKPIIYKIASKYYEFSKNRGLELDDLVQEGYFGLYNALINYSDNKGCLFYTYALKAINSKIRNLYIRSNNLKSRVLNSSISLFSKANFEDESVIMDFIEDPTSVNPTNEILNIELMDNFKNALYGMNIRDASILELKMNGFTNKAISILLSKHQNLVSKDISRIKRILETNFLFEKDSY